MRVLRPTICVATRLQIKRLEELVGAKLLQHKGKALELTPQGHALIGYAREMLRLNDRAVANPEFFFVIIALFFHCVNPAELNSLEHLT